MPDHVMTVLGPVAAEELGVTLMHEHILIDLTREIRHGGILNDVPTAIAELRRFKEAGGATVVDVTVRGLGGNPAALRDISRATGVHVVLGAGMYRHQYHDADWLDRTSTDELAAVFVHDVEEGVEGTGVRAGIIGEIACDEWITAAEERVFRAAARAHLRTGLTITTHAARWPVGIAQLDLLEEEGVDPRRVVIGHSDTIASVHWRDAQDVLDYHEELARRGAFVEFDTVRVHPPHELERRVTYVRNLIDKGHVDKVLLSHDVCVQAHLRCNGGGGYTMVLEEFSQLLREAGVTEEQLTTILVANPRRALTSGGR